MRFRECVDDGGEITCAGARGVATSSVFIRVLKAISNKAAMKVYGKNEHTSGGYEAAMSL